MASAPAGTLWSPALLSPTAWWDFTKALAGEADGSTPTFPIAEQTGTWPLYGVGSTSVTTPQVRASGIGGLPSLYFQRGANGLGKTPLVTTAAGFPVGTGFSFLAVMDSDRGTPQMLTYAEQGAEAGSLGRWQTGYSDQQHSTPVISTTYAHSGSSSFHLPPSSEGTANSNQVNYFSTAQDNSGSAFALGMVAGHTYQISGWLLVPTGQAAPAGFYVPITAFYYSAGSFHQTTGAFFAASGTQGTWQQWTLTLAIPAGASSAFVRWNGPYSTYDTPGALGVWWDDLSVLDITPVGTSAMLGPSSQGPCYVQRTATPGTSWASGTGSLLLGVYSIVSVGAWDGTSDDYLAITGGLLPDSTPAPHVIEQIDPGTYAGHALFADGNAVTAPHLVAYGGAFGQDPAPSATTGQLLLGGDAQQTWTYSGRIAEAVVVPRGITSAERASWHSYVQAKYGVTASDATALPPLPGLTVTGTGNPSGSATSAGALTVTAGAGAAATTSAAGALTITASTPVDHTGTPGLANTTSLTALAATTSLEGTASIH